MTTLYLAKKAILRADPDYFSSYSLFDTINQKLFPLVPAQFELMSAIARYGLDESLAEQAFRTFSLLQDISARQNWSSIRQTCLSEERNLRDDELPVPNVRVSQSPGKAPSTATPTFLDLCITRRCNLACVHCNVSAHSLKPTEKSSLSFWNGLLDQCVANKVLKIVITGGEPTQHKSWEDIYDYICRKPLAVSILTNGVDLSRKTIANARQNGHNFAISLDGAAASVHDDFRRAPGSFEKTIDTLQVLRDCEVPFTLSVTLHQFNLDATDALIGIAEKFGALAICFNVINGVGRGGSHYAQKYYPAKNEVGIVLRRLRDMAIAGRGTEVVIGDFEEREYLHISSKITGSTQMSRRNPGLCKAGIYALAVDEDGKVYSCLRGLQTKSFPIGDAKRQSLTEIWNASGWNDFRDLKLPRVACRIEEIERSRSQMPQPRVLTELLS